MGCELAQGDPFPVNRETDRQTGLKTLPSHKPCMKVVMKTNTRVHVRSLV